MIKTIFHLKEICEQDFSYTARNTEKWHEAHKNDAK